jgi:hypothetical protein
VVFYLTELYSLASELNLIVHPANEIKTSIVAIPDKISCIIYSSAATRYPRRALQ